MKPHRSLASLRWFAAIAFVGAGHAAAVGSLARWHQADTPASDNAPAAVMIDLAASSVPAPLSATPPARETAAEPTPPPQPQEKQADTADQPVRPVQETLTPAPAPPEPSTIRLPDPPRAEKAEATVAPPAAPRKEPPLKPVQRERAQPKKQLPPPDKPKPGRSAAPPATPALTGQKAAAPIAGSSRVATVSPAAWQSRVMAHLDSHKRFPEGAGFGTSLIAFTIDRNGRVLSARLTRSSGDATLDREAAAIPRRASPVPAPPAGIGGSSITMTMPIRFGRR